jgi:hypothetical protein
MPRLAAARALGVLLAVAVAVGPALGDGSGPEPTADSRTRLEGVRAVRKGMVRWEVEQLLGEAADLEVKFNKVAGRTCTYPRSKVMVVYDGNQKVLHASPYTYPLD